jgi:hypothetical protein
MKEFLKSLEDQLQKPSNFFETISINNGEINLKDDSDNLLYQQFGKNKISSSEVFKNASHQEKLKKISDYIVFAIKSRNRTLVSWCLLKLLEEIQLASRTIVLTHDLRSLNKSIETEVLPNDFTILYLWYMHKLFHSENDRPSDQLLAHLIRPGMRKYFIDHFSDELTALHKILLPYASKIDTIIIAQDRPFAEVYRDHLSINSTLPKIKYQSKFEQYEKIFTISKDEPIQCFLYLIADYLKFENSLTSPLRERFFRVISGQWNQHHNETVKGLINSNSYHSIPKFGLEIEFLLEGLRSRLLSAGKKINPDGTLAQIINFTQLKLRQEVINIDELNDAISRNKENNLHYQLPVLSRTFFR